MGTHATSDISLCANLYVEGEVADVDLAGGPVDSGGHPHHQAVRVHHTVGLVLRLCGTAEKIMILLVGDALV